MPSKSLPTFVSNLQHGQQGAVLIVLCSRSRPEFSHRLQVLNLPFCPRGTKLSPTHRAHRAREARRGLALAELLSNAPSHNRMNERVTADYSDGVFMEKFLIPPQKVF